MAETPYLELFRLDIGNGGIETQISPDPWFHLEYHAGKYAVLGAYESRLARIQADGGGLAFLTEPSDRKVDRSSEGVWSPLGDQVITSESVKTGRDSIDTLKVISSEDGSEVADVLQMKNYNFGKILGWFPKD